MQMFLAIQKSKGALQALLLIAYTYFLNTFIIFKQDGKKVLGSNPLSAWAFLCMPGWILSGFLPQSKDIHSCRCECDHE